MKKFLIIAFLFLIIPFSVLFIHVEASTGKTLSIVPILVVDGTGVTDYRGALYRVNPASGDRTMLSDFGNSAQGPLGEEPRRVAVETSGNILVTDWFAGTNRGDPLYPSGALFRVNPTTGSRTILSDFGNSAQGPLGYSVKDVAVEPSGNILVTAEVGEHIYDIGLFRVDPTSGNRTRLDNIGNLTELGRGLSGVAVEASGNILISDDIELALYRWNPNTDDLTVLSDFGNSAQGPQGTTWIGDMDVEASGNILVADEGAGTDGRGALFRVDPTTGSRTILSDFGNLAQGPLSGAYHGIGVAVEVSGNILATDFYSGALFRVDPISGNRTTLSNFYSASGVAIPGLPGVWVPRPVSVAFDGFKTLYFTSFDADLFSPTYAGRVWSIKTDGTGFTTVANLPGGVPRFGGEAPRNIIALAYDSSRNGLWLSVSPVNDLNFFDLDTNTFAFPSTSSTSGINLPAQAAGALNAPNGLAHDPDTDRLFFSAAAGPGGEGDTIFQVTAQTMFNTNSLGPITEFYLNAYTGGNNGMAWDGEKLWLAREGPILGDPFIGTFDPNPLLLTPREGGPTFFDAGAPNGLAFDDFTFAPSCALWATATSTDGNQQLLAYDIPCPTFEETDVTPPTFECGEITPPGSREITFQDLESGLAQIFTIGNPPINQNADIFIPEFVEGTRSPVTVTVNRLDHNEEARIGLRACDVQGICVNATICTIPAGIDPLDIDDDGDLFTENEGDCDDNDDTVFPGAPELADGKDNDCDGLVDQGVYDDADGDGYTEADGDCDDNDDTVFPGAPELADGKDNDCDGLIDEGIGVEGDLDGDGDVDRDDVNIIGSYRNQPASVCPECDIDGDGMITVLDARKLVLKCTCPSCLSPPCP